MHSSFKTDDLIVVFCINIRKHSVLPLKFRGLVQHHSITWDGLYATYLWDLLWQLHVLLYNLLTLQWALLIYILHLLTKILLRIDQGY